jgi:exonuclease 3'-5' domain-containing protein 1
MEHVTRYTYCNDLSSVTYATRVLARSSFLIIDCEGKNLGGKYGVLSLMCIGTERAEEIFVFDVLALKACNPQTRLRPLMNILADPLVKKIMWDCRNDFLEILDEYGVALQGVLDLQLAEIESRTSVRGELEWKRTARLASRGRLLPLPLIKQNPNLFSGVHSLQGMDSCIRQAHLPTAGKDRKYFRHCVFACQYQLVHRSTGSSHAQDARFCHMAGETTVIAAPPVRSP